MAGNAQTSGSVLYLGRHPRGVDKSRRVMLPSEWRSKEAPTEFTVLRWPPKCPEYLLVLPPKRWEQMLEKLGNVSLMNEPGATMERFISANASQKSLDGYGRLPLPDEAAKAAGIEAEAVLIGRMNKFEIWSPGRFQASQETSDTQKAFEALSSMDL